MARGDPGGAGRKGPQAARRQRALPAALPEYREAAAEAAQDADLPAYARQCGETYFDALAQ